MGNYLSFSTPETATNPEETTTKNTVSTTGVNDLITIGASDEVTLDATVTPTVDDAVSDNASTDGLGYSISKFNMDKFRKHSMSLIIGKRSTGKTTLIRDILYHNKDIPYGKLVWHSYNSNTYDTNIPSELISEDVGEIPTIITNAIARQQNINKHVYKYEKDTWKIYDGEDRSMFLALDDMAYDNAWLKHKDTRGLFFNRHSLRLLTIISMQYDIGLSPVFRSNSDYIFIGRENNVQNRKKLYQMYAGIFPTYDVFCKVLDTYTAESHQFLVIDYTAPCNNIEDCVFWYKAELHDDLELCQNYRDVDASFNLKSNDYNTISTDTDTDAPY